MSQQRYLRPIQYSLVGALGFLVDAGLLTLLVSVYDFDPILSRGPSFVAAVSVTWLLNRSFTFATRRYYAKSTEYRRYISVQIAGSVANLLVYVGLIAVMPMLGRMPVVPLAVGAVAGLAVNYYLSATIVFPERR